LEDKLTDFTAPGETRGAVGEGRRGVTVGDEPLVAGNCGDPHPLRRTNKLQKPSIRSHGRIRRIKNLLFQGNDIFSSEERDGVPRWSQSFTHGKIITRLSVMKRVVLGRSSRRLRMARSKPALLVSSGTSSQQELKGRAKRTTMWYAVSCMHKSTRPISLI
jgi:hypothetical protein